MLGDQKLTDIAIIIIVGERAVMISYGLKSCTRLSVGAQWTCGHSLRMKREECRRC